MDRVHHLLRQMVSVLQKLFLPNKAELALFCTSCTICISNDLSHALSVTLPPSLKENVTGVKAEFHRVKIWIADGMLFLLKENNVFYYPLR
jgi:hypothetical protein